MSQEIESDDIAQQAESLRAEARRLCDELNDDLEAEVLEKFGHGEVAAFFRDNTSDVVKILSRKCRQAQAGGPFSPLRPYDAETLFRLLTTLDRLSYKCWEVEDMLSDEETVGSFPEDLLRRTSGSVRPNEVDLVDDVEEALRAYARAAAIYAKHIGSSSLLEWVEILDILEHGRHKVDGWTIATHYKGVEGRRLVELEHAAAQRLHLEKMALGLPKFHPRKTAKKKAK